MLQSRFDISLSPSSLHFVCLRSRHYVEESNWSCFALFGMSVGSMYLAWEALAQLIPDVFIDTMGYAFMFPVVAWLTGVPVGAYVHYPALTPDALARAKARARWNAKSDANIALSVLSFGRLLYACSRI
jgi:alpha-1,2-mannosyltransferase